jgi:DNA-binding response OmpR family regulator
MGCVLVDDDKSICSLLNAFFTKIAYQVEVPHDGEARIKCFDNGPVFDLGMKKKCTIPCCKTRQMYRKSTGSEVRRDPPPLTRT